MAGPGLPTSVTGGNSGHLTHTNSVHAIVNQFDTTLVGITGHVPVGTGSVFDNRALLSTDIPAIVVNAQSASYTLVLADAGKLVEISNPSSNTLTVPPNSSVAFPVGSQVSVRQYGAGTTTITQGAGVTIRSRGGLLAMAGTYAEAVLTKRATDEWVLAGDVA